MKSMTVYPLEGGEVTLPKVNFFNCALRSRAAFFDFRYFTGFSPEIIGFSKTALTFFMKLTGKSPKKSRNSTKMSKMKSDTVEGVILHDFAIFGLYE